MVLDPVRSKQPTFYTEWQYPSPGMFALLRCFCFFFDTSSTSCSSRHTKRQVPSALITLVMAPITANDAVHIKGKHLFKSDGSPFFVKGIAFPTPPEAMMAEKHRGYNATAWLNVLKQLRELDSEFNTIRLYRMYPDTVHYSQFFEGAAEVGIYIIVPLTASVSTSEYMTCRHLYLLEYQCQIDASICF